VRVPVAPPLSLSVLLRACRPRQWSKNLLVLAAPCAAGVIARPGVAVEVVAAFVVFCMLSSATYLINDVRDRDQDRQHPRKRARPVASGALSSRAAVVIATVLALGGLALATTVRPALGAVGCAYLVLTASYSLWWRRVVVADIVAVAAGFLLRAVAGGAATDVFLSRWFLLVTSFCAVFLVAGKRYAELIDGPPSALGRSTLRHYSSGSLRLLLAAAALSASVAYAAWALTRPQNGLWYELSMAPFVLWLARYAVLLGRGAGEAPEDLILRDRVLLALGVVWGFVFLASVYASS
jgi:decaprenyl-phosphate phosphoribosyltransferase